MSTLANAALAYARAGWFVFPLRQNRKEPQLGGGVNDAACDLNIVAAWWKKYPLANIGIALMASGLGVVDVDVKPEKAIDGRPVIEELELLYGPVGNVAHQTTPSGGEHHVFKMNKRFPVVDKAHWMHGIDVFTAKHRYIVAWPSVVNEKQYEWAADGLEPWDMVGQLSPHWAKLLRAENRSPQAPPTGEPADLLDTMALRVPGVDLAELKGVLAVLPPDMERDSWLRVLWGAAAQWHGTKADGDVIDALEEWSATTTKAGQYKRGEVKARWLEHSSRNGGRSGAGHVTWRSVRAMAQKHGWSPFTLGGIDPTKWKSYLKTKRDESGKVGIRPTAWNAALLYSFHPKLRGCIKRNVLTNAIEMHKPIVCPLRDPTRLPKAFDKDSDWIGAGSAVEPFVNGSMPQSVIVAASAAAATVHSYDPIKDWVESLEWDGVPRLDEWICTVTHAKNSALHRAIGRAWIIGLAARAMAEYDGRGTKMDSVLVLQGNEGIGKSTIGAIMGAEWYSSFSNSLAGEEVYYTIERSVVLEFEELDAMSRSDASRVKALVTTQADTFRRKYGATADSKPRRCVFLGTVNDHTFLTRDMTMRRWWVVRCGTQAFNLKWLREHREQLIAEGKAAFENGELPMLPTELHADHKVSVEDARIEHPYEGAVKAWSDRQEPFTSMDLMVAVEQALGRSPTTMTMAELRKFGEVMRQFGWSKKGTRTGKRWVKDL